MTHVAETVQIEERPEKKRNKVAVGIVLGIFASLMVGFALGLVYAPQSGRRTRRQIREKAYAVKSRISGFIEWAKCVFRRQPKEETYVIGTGVISASRKARGSI